MDSDVAEGISTSLETCPPFPNSQELHALMGILTSPLHVNDLGLTPPPGSRLQDSTDSSVEPSQDEATCSGKTGCPANPSDSNDSLSHARGELEEASGGQGATDQPLDEAGGSSTTEYPTSVQPSTAGEDLFDPLFDPNFSIPELDSVFSSREGERKRAVEEAFLHDSELWALPEKRQHVESPTSLDETPSLTDSSTQQSPASFFDTFDLLFGDPANDIPLGFSNNTVPDPFCVPPEQIDDIIQPVVSDDAADNLPLGEFLVDNPLVSESTKKRFLLNEQDLLANTTREVLQVRKEPDYMSPYPVSGGPLGYFPSSPGIHVKFIEVAEDQTNSRLSILRNKVQRLTYERNQCKKALSQCAMVDGTTGKTTEQMLREENAMLRRVSSRHQSRVEEYKKEAAEWRSKLHDLGVIYNNLLYEIGVQNRLPAVGPVPNGYKPPRMSAPLGIQLPLSNRAPNASSQSLAPIAPRSRQQNEPITIDLTEEQDVSPVTPVTPNSPPKETERRMAMLQSLQTKKYAWLRDGPPSGVLTVPNRSNPLDSEEELARLMEEELSRG